MNLHLPTSSLSQQQQQLSLAASFNSSDLINSTHTHTPYVFHKSQLASPTSQWLLLPPPLPRRRHQRRQAPRASRRLLPRAVARERRTTPETPWPRCKHTSRLTATSTRTCLSRSSSKSSARSGKLLLKTPRTALERTANCFL